MKPYKNDREVLKLKSNYEYGQFYGPKNGLFSKYKNNRKDAVLDLKKALKIGDDNYKVTQEQI